MMRQNAQTDETDQTVGVLFVCTGNICRSPTAEAVFRAEVKKRHLDHCLRVDSAGTTDYHQGEPPDQRSLETAAKRGYDMHHQKARQVCDADFREYVYIVALDRHHQRYLEDRYAHVPERHPHLRLVKLLDYLSPQPGQPGGDVPDPYYGGSQGFERVLDLIETSCCHLIDQITRENSLPERPAKSFSPRNAPET